MSDAPAGTSPQSTLDVAALRRTAGANAVGEAEARHEVDGRRPAIVVRPATVEALAATLAEADAQGLAVILQGGRSALGVGNRPSRYDIALETGALGEITAFEPEDFTVTVQGGMPFATLQRTLAERGQFVPLDPPLPAAATVGGVLAAGRGGPRRAAYGSVRDWLIGCSVVLADGARIKGGGRVVKNVSGYDLPKLFAGSWGTLGCIVEASFKLRPLPPADATLTLPRDGFDAALALARRLANAVSGLTAVLALDQATARHVGLAGAGVVLRAEGVKAAVDATLDAVRDLAEAAERPRPSDPGLWKSLADLEAVPFAPDRLLLRCGLPPSRLSEAASALRVAWPDARLWAYADSGLLLAEVTAESAEELVAPRRAIEPMQGSLVVEVAPTSLKATLDVWGSPGEGLRIMRAVKQQFDPKATLSPGRFVGGI